MTDYLTVAVIGVGTMSEAMVRLALEQGWPREKLILTHRRAERRAELEERYGGKVEADNAAAAAKSDAVLVSVRPQDLEEMLRQIQPALHAGQLYISIAAAQDIPWLERHLPQGMAIVRAVPPPTTWIKAGLTYLAANSRATAQQREAAERLFKPTCERILWMPDEMIDPVTAIGQATTPYLCLIVKALLQTGIEQGVPAEMAREATYEGIFAAARMMHDAGYDPDEIIPLIATREGLSWASLHTMEKRGVPEGVRAGVLAMMARALELRGDPIPPEMQDFER